MGVFRSEILKIGNIQRDILPIIQRTVNQFRDELEEYNTKFQLSDKGEDNQGEKIKPAYTRFTISIKKTKGQPTDRVTLKDTGSFHRSIHVIAESNRMRIVSNHHLADELIQKYGKDVIGVQEKYLNEFVNKRLIPALKRNINDKLATA